MPMSRTNACNRLIFSHAAINGTHTRISPPSNSNAWSTRVQAVLASCRRTLRRSNRPLKITFHVSAIRLIARVTMPISRAGLPMIHASKGVQINNAKASKPMAWHTRSAMDLVGLMTGLRE